VGNEAGRNQTGKEPREPAIVTGVKVDFGLTFLGWRAYNKEMQKARGHDEVGHGPKINNEGILPGASAKINTFVWMILLSRRNRFRATGPVAGELPLGKHAFVSLEPNGRGVRPDQAAASIREPPWRLWAVPRQGAPGRVGDDGA
jgi:hypothetical protein